MEAVRTPKIGVYMQNAFDSDIIRILIVDDNTSIHKDFREVFKTKTEDEDLKEMDALLFGDEESAASEETFELFRHFQLSFATQGREAYELAKQTAQNGEYFALAFVDMLMPPGWDGLKTIRHLWEVQPDLQVVICTAYSDYSWSEVHNCLGLSDQLLILKKPFESPEVAQMAVALTKKWQLTKRLERIMEETQTMVQEHMKKHQSVMAESSQRARHEMAADLQHKAQTHLSNILRSCEAMRAAIPDEALQHLMDLEDASKALEHIFMTKTSE